MLFWCYRGEGGMRYTTMLLPPTLSNLRVGRNSYSQMQLASTHLENPKNDFKTLMGSKHLFQRGTNLLGTQPHTWARYGVQTTTTLSQTNEVVVHIWYNSHTSDNFMSQMSEFFKREISLIINYLAQWLHLWNLGSPEGSAVPIWTIWSIYIL
jgi:hypothetical protein